MPDQILLLTDGRTLPYAIVYSRRRSIGVEITRDGKVLVRAPLRSSLSFIERFLKGHESWILKHLEKVEEKNKKAEEITPMSREELKALAAKALAEIPPRVEYYAGRIGVTYGRITIRNERTLWGSCSAKGNLNFNCLLMTMPREIIDYVIIHELCHRLEMNHSKRFWDLVSRYCPDYKERRKWLKENGDTVMLSMKKGQGY